MKNKQIEYKKSKTLRLLELGAEETDTRELIRRRWMQVLIHSCIYYRLNASVIEDNQWNKWARELYDLVKKYPKIAQGMIYHEALLKFDPATGFDLPISQPYIVKRAEAIIKLTEENKIKRRKSHEPVSKTHRRFSKRHKQRTHGIHKSKHH
jgi:hypothetical protein